MALVKRKTWQAVLDTGELILLPSLHDGLTAKLIEQAGFRACQVGGFSVVGARFGLPDIDLAQFGKLSQTVREVLDASGRYPVAEKGLDFGQYEKVVGLGDWSDIETRYMESTTSVQVAPSSADHKRSGGARVY